MRPRKLTEADEAEIRERVRVREMWKWMNSNKRLAADYGVSVSLIAKLSQEAHDNAVLEAAHQALHGPCGKDRPV